MPTPQVYFSFLGIVFILAYTPGPNVLLMVKNGIEYQFKDALFAVPGVALAVFTYALLVSVGLAQTMIDYPIIFNSIRVSGSCYLIYLGIRSFYKIYFLKNEEKFNDKKTESKKNRFNLFTSGYICAITNPKIFVLYLSFFPQFINQDKSPLAQFILLGVTHSFVSSTSMVFYCALANRAQNFIRKYSNIQISITNLIFILLGFFLLAHSTQFNPA